MKSFIFLGSALLCASSSIDASVVTLGSSLAESCYHAADARASDMEALRNCDLALAEEGLDFHDRVGTYVNRGIVRLIGGDVGRADEDFNAALAINNREPEAWLNKAVAALDQHHSDAAIRMAEQALELRTSKPELAYLVRGLAREDQGQLQSAYSDLVRARDLAPAWPEPQTELARYQIRHR